MQDGLVVTVRNVKTQVRTGVFDHERNGPQPVTVEISMTVEVPHRFRPDSSLGESVDYDDVLAYLADALPQKPHLNLLESVADDILAFLFSKPGVTAASVGLTKDRLAVDGRQVGIELTRRNPAPKPLQEQEAPA